MPPTFNRQIENTNQTSLAALEVKPLPYESSLSLISYFSWRNVLRKRQVNKHLGLKVAFGAKQILRDYIRPSSVLKTLTGYSFPLSIEVLIRECLGSSVDIWFDSELKICPVCLEHGYHSIWHQFRLLDVCPVHACRLTKLCVSCGQGPHKYTLECDRAYYCRHCQQPFAGAKPNILATNEFRQHHLCMKQAFFPFEVWLRHANRLTRPLKAIVDNNPLYNEMWQSWCVPQDLLLSFGCMLCPPPIICATPRYRSLHIRGCEFRSYLPAISSETKYSYPVGHRDTLIYRVVLEEISEWIANVPVEHAEDFHIAIGFDNRVLKSIIDIRVAACGVLRFMLEAIDADHWNSPIRYAFLSKKLPVQLPRPTYQIPDRVFRLLFLEIFSTILILIENAPKQQLIDMMQLQLAVHKMVAFGWHFDKRVMYCYTICPESKLLQSLADSMIRPTFDIRLD